MRNQILRNTRLILREINYIGPKFTCSDQFSLTRCFATTILNNAKPAFVPAAGAVLKSKVGPTLEKTKLPVETDPERLVKYVCGTDYAKDSQPIEIKDDSEYPDWLWEVRLGPAPPLDEMDKNTKQYWRRTFAYWRRYHKGLKKLRKF